VAEAASGGAGRLGSKGEIDWSSAILDAAAVRAKKGDH
jgi:hypothetical protein